MALKRLRSGNLAAVLLVGSFLVGLAASAAMAQEGGVTMGPGGRVITGKSQFLEYCGQCHGPNAIGNGPVAPALKKKPANLTVLTKNNGGVFPEQTVRDFIDGSKVSAAHGTREMPLWGNAFRIGGTGPRGGQPLTEPEVKEKIQLLVDYVKSIQAE